MNILIAGSKKGPKVAAHSLITISRFLTSMHKVNERLKDLLADTVSSMSMQIKMFVPVISGIVVGLSALTTNILLNLGTQLGALESGGSASSEYSFGAGLLDIFQLESMLPLHLFQIIVGLYLVQIIFILSYMLSGIIHGQDKIEKNYALGQNLVLGTAIYVVITIATAVLFVSLTGSLAAPV